MKTITRDGKFDHLFRDDRDPRIKAMTLKEQLPSYGENNLHKPNRALTSDEIEAINRVGTVSPPSDKKD
jgi:hypothetical protein